MWPFKKKSVSFKDADTTINNSDLKIKFYYDVANIAEADAFWDKAVDDAHNTDSGKETDKSSLRLIEPIFIRNKKDTEFPDDPEYDWRTTIWIYSDDTRNQLRYFLEESFLSLWDAFPVFRGGEISYELFKEYMKKIKNDKYV